MLLKLLSAHEPPDVVSEVVSPSGGPAVWGIRQCDLDPRFDRWSTWATAALCTSLSRFLPARIVVCSEYASVARGEFRYTRERMVGIPNRFDMGRLRPDIEARYRRLYEDVLIDVRADRLH